MPALGIRPIGLPPYPSLETHNSKPEPTASKVLSTTAPPPPTLNPELYTLNPNHKPSLRVHPYSLALAH
jgi:hypothetical protein